MKKCLIVFIVLIVSLMPLCVYAEYDASNGIDCNYDTFDPGIKASGLQHIADYDGTLVYDNWVMMQDGVSNGTNQEAIYLFDYVKYENDSSRTTPLLFTDKTNTTYCKYDDDSGTWGDWIVGGNGKSLGYYDYPSDILSSPKVAYITCPVNKAYISPDYLAWNFIQTHNYDTSEYCDAEEFTLHWGEVISVTNISSESIVANGIADIDVGALGDVLTLKYIDDTDVNVVGINRMFPYKDINIGVGETITFSIVNSPSIADTVIFRVPFGSILKNSGSSLIKIYDNDRFGVTNDTGEDGNIIFEPSVIGDYIVEDFNGGLSLHQDISISHILLADGEKVSIKVDGIQTPYNYSDMDIDNMVLSNIPYHSFETIFPDDVGDLIYNDPTIFQEGDCLGQWVIETQNPYIGGSTYKFSIPFSKDSIWDDKDDIELYMYVDGYRFTPPINEDELYIARSIFSTTEGVFTLTDYVAELNVMIAESTLLEDGENHTLYAVAKWDGETRVSDYIYHNYSEDEYDALPDDEQTLGTISEDLDEDEIGFVPSIEEQYDNEVNDPNSNVVTLPSFPSVHLDGSAGYIGANLQSNFGYAYEKLNPTMSGMMGDKWLWLIICFCIFFSILKMV